MEQDFRFSTEMEVSIGDINYGGHLGNDKFLVLFQEARLRYLDQFGFSEMSIGEDVSLIMSQAQVNFKAEAFWGDRLKIFVRISHLEKIRFTFDYLIIKDEGAEVIVATGFTKMVGFNYKERKVKKLPSVFLNKITEFERLD